jgi:hypothetical protein
MYKGGFLHLNLSKSPSKQDPDVMGLLLLF